MGHHCSSSARAEEQLKQPTGWGEVAKRLLPTLIRTVLEKRDEKCHAGYAPPCSLQLPTKKRLEKIRLASLGAGGGGGDITKALK